MVGFAPDFAGRRFGRDPVLPPREKNLEFRYAPVTLIQLGNDQAAGAGSPEPGALIVNVAGTPMMLSLEPAVSGAGSAFGDPAFAMAFNSYVAMNSSLTVGITSVDLRHERQFCRAIGPVLQALIPNFPALVCPPWEGAWSCRE